MDSPAETQEEVGADTGQQRRSFASGKMRNSSSQEPRCLNLWSRQLILARRRELASPRDRVDCQVGRR